MRRKGILANSSSDNGDPYDQINIRGFNVGSLYTNGFRQDVFYGGGGTGFGQAQFANVASIEVLKGSSAGLYGVAEPGGIVDIITKTPLDAPYYKASQDVSSLGLYRTEIDATGPLTADKAWLYRMNMSYEANAGAFGFEVHDIHFDNIFLAPVIQWKYDDNNWIKLESTYSQNRAASFFPNTPEINGNLLTVPRNLNYGESSPSFQNSIFNLLTIQKQLGADWSLKQTVGQTYAVTDSTFALSNSFGGNPTPPYLAYARAYYENIYRQAQYGTTTDVTGHAETLGLQHTVLLGGDFHKTVTYTEYMGNYLYGSPNPVIYPLTPGYPYLPPVLGGNEGTGYTNTGGLYLQDQVKLPYDVSLTAGARYQYIRENGGIGGAPLINANFNAQASNAKADTQTALTPRVALLWQPVPWASLYAHYVEGFSVNSGAFLVGNVIAPPTNAHESEAGAKFEFYEGKLRATASLYDLTKTNVPQIDTNPADVCGPGGPNSCVVLSGEQRSKGVELDIQGTLQPGWEVILNYANQDVRLTKTYPGDPTGTPGSRVQGVPRNLGNFWTTYEFQDGELSGLKIGGGVHYHGSQIPFGLTSQPFWGTLVGAWATIDLMAAYRFKVGDTNMTAQLNIYNLLDKTYYVDKIYYPYNVGIGSGSASYGQQFTVRGSLSAELSSRSAPWIHAPAPHTTPSDWTGLYLGEQIGYLWGDNNGGYNFVTPDGSFANTNFYDAAQSVIVGLHGGYNKQFGSWVAGLEGSVDGLNLKKNNPSVFPDYLSTLGLNFYGIVTGSGGSIYSTLRSDIQGSIRGRLGFDWDHLLIYGTGGVAISDFALQANMGSLIVNPATFPPPVSIPSYAAAPERTLTRVGWTLGGGLEYAIDKNWSVRTEYRYSDFGSVSEAANLVSSPGVFFAGERHFNQNQIQVGFSYKFVEPDPEPAGLAAPAFGIPSISPAGPRCPRTLPGFFATKAGDPPVKDAAPLAGPLDWTGFYLGANAGYVWGLNHGGYSFVTPFGYTGYDTLAYIPSNLINPVDLNAQGVIAGFHFGYDRQLDSIVVGLEAAVDATNEAKTVAAPIPDTNIIPNGPTATPPAGVLTSNVKSQVQGTLRARAGYALGRLMPFVAAGGALGSITVQSDMIGADPASAVFYAANTGQTIVRLG